MAEIGFTLTHGDTVSSTYGVPIVIENKTDVFRKVVITAVEGKAEDEADYRAEKFSLMTGLPGSPLSYMDLDPYETRNYHVLLQDRYLKLEGPQIPGGLGSSRRTTWNGSTCASLVFQITATDRATKESVILCGENRASPAEQLPDWAVEERKCKALMALEALEANDMVALWQGPNGHRYAGGLEYMCNHPEVSIAEDGGSLLHRTARNGLLEATQLLLEKKADVNAKDKTVTQNDATPLGQAIDRITGCSGSIQNCRSTSADHFRIVQLLVENKADINSVDCIKNSALHRSIRSQELVRFLLEKNADIDHADMHNASPIFTAVKVGEAQTARLLLEQRADVNYVGGHEGSYGPLNQLHGGSMTPLDCCSPSTEMEALLKEHGGLSKSQL